MTFKPCCANLEELLDLYCAMEKLHQVYDVLKRGGDSEAKLFDLTKKLTDMKVAAIELLEDFCACPTCENNVTAIRDNFFHLIF